MGSNGVPEEMKSKKKENAVRNLVSLYTVVIGVALSLAVVGLVDPGRGLASLSPSSCFLFLAFVSTLLPFFHGAMRHLDDAYLENEAVVIKDGALIVDFVLLFFHGLAFVVLSLLLQQPVEFAWVLISVLGIDILWAAFAHFASSSEQIGGVEGKWGLINLTFVVIGVILLVTNNVHFWSLTSGSKLSVSIALLCVLRTVVDYAWCREFYFPR